MTHATPSTPPDPSIPAELHREGSASAEGFRLPADWEPLEAVWLSRPRDEKAFPGCLAAAQTEWDNFSARLREVVEVRETASMGIPTDSCLIRDFGPVFLTHPSGGLAAQILRPDAEGDAREPRLLDAAVPTAIARRCRVPIRRHADALGGGSFGTDGLGTLLIDERCLGNLARGSDRGHQGAESMLRETLGVSAIVRLPGWDDEEGVRARRLDGLARFIAPGVVATVEAPPGHPDHASLAANRDVLCRAVDARGERIEVVPLPTPTPIHHELPASGPALGGRTMLPASHADFLVANGRIFVPVFGSRSDELACRRLEETSGLRAVAVMARHLVVGFGGLHRLSCQQPAAAPK